MVDVGDKSITKRTATAHSNIIVGPEIFKLIKDNQVKKGDVLTVAQIAATLAAKRTSDLIPLCHNIFLSSVKTDLKLVETDFSVDITSTVKCEGKTGVEMEALTACTIAALTIYDMCKAVSHEMVIRDVRLMHKAGGKSLYNSKIQFSSFNGDNVQ
uniref:cyclic pyranopterin monophosphate synthase n=1 Tax=Culicoides sonorensis TaxID=179676 RepID=A0A336LI95_CULSO